MHAPADRASLLRVQPGRATTTRCALCHDDDERLDRCVDCGSLAHSDCAEALGACPSLGCGGVFAAPTRDRWAEGAVGTGAYVVWMVCLLVGVATACVVGQVGWVLVGCFGGLAFGASWGPALEQVGGWGCHAAAAALALLTLGLLGASLFTQDIRLGEELRGDGPRLNEVQELMRERIDR